MWPRDDPKLQEFERLLDKFDLAVARAATDGSKGRERQYRADRLALTKWAAEVVAERDKARDDRIELERLVEYEGCQRALADARVREQGDANIELKAQLAAADRDRTILLRTEASQRKRATEAESQLTVARGLLKRAASLIAELVSDGPEWHYQWCAREASREAECTCGGDPARALLTELDAEKGGLDMPRHGGHTA